MPQLQTVFADPHEKKKQRVFHKASPTPATIPPPSREVVRKVKQELTEENAKKSIEQAERLHSLVTKSSHVLYRCQSVFPFDLFPDEISIEPTQVHVVKRTFFSTNHRQTIPIKNISDVHVQSTPLFSKMKFVDRSFADNTLEIDFLKTDDAEKVRRIVQGLIIATTEDVDVGDVNEEVLKEEVEKLGSMQEIKETD